VSPDAEGARLLYRTPVASVEAALELVRVVRGEETHHFPFHDRLEVGRYEHGREHRVGCLLVEDPTVSFHHCILNRRSDGRCFLRDISRNGTLVDGRRLVPSVEVEIQPGQTISVGEGNEFLLRGGPGLPGDPEPNAPFRGTLVTRATTNVTLLVGDIKDYTVLVREVPSDVLQPAVVRVFDALEKIVIKHGGTVKEYQGDAIFAFWEDRDDVNRASAACHAALALNREARRLAEEPGVWTAPGFPLHVDWALATGTVVLRRLGEDTATGLSMIGEVVPLAFRLEKLASDDTGPIIACAATRELAVDGFVFRDLGRVEVKGFDVPPRAFALEGHVTPRKGGP
jgi:adenylate cyclase